ncbi:MAG: membrane integrity-associated transporter subunit PqiC [Deltaproteobacteria bacterium]|nr:membrane integrity-associated transporter subunit PqiC [Deltaproteobacteria bacterium]
MNCLKMMLKLGLGLVLLLGGCMKAKHPGHQIEYYTLEYEPPAVAELEPIPVVLRIERFGVAPNFNTNRIVYRERSYRREAYVYKRWRSNPADLVTYFLSRDIKRSGLFQAVLPYDTRVAPSYVIEGTVDEFVEWDTTALWEAVMSLSITLMDENEPDISKRILFQKTYQVSEPCRERKPAALAEAMSRAMAKISAEIIQDLHARLKDRTEGGGS